MNRSTKLAAIAIVLLALTGATLGQQPPTTVRILPPPHKHTGKGVLRANSCPKISYPERSLAAGLSGTGQFRVDLTAQATYVSSELVTSSGTPELDQAARLALPRCTYTPSFNEGTPVADSLIVEFVWSLSPSPAVAFDSK